jgi:hypothetical protein
MKSMLIDNLGPNFNNDVGHVTDGAGSGNAFNTWDEAAMAIESGETDVKLEFDFSWDHSNVTSPAWAQLGIFVNSTGAGFRQYGTGGLIGGNTSGLDPFPRLETAAIADGVTLTSLGPNTIHLAIPMGPTKSLNIGGGAPGTNFYQMGFKTNGGWAGTVDWAIDNVQITGAQVPTVQETLFSWETPDNPGTPGVDERFEGWIPGNIQNNPPHAHSITTTGATDGAFALQVDRTGTPSGFTWGSVFELNSDTNPDPQIEDIDPVIQARIEELIGKVEAADRVAFDVTYQYVDHFPLELTFTNFGIHFSDETGKFYQAFGDNIDVRSAATPTTTTVEIPLDEFVDANDNMLTLKTTGLLDDSNFFRIGISTSTDDGQIYQIDNFRLITEVPEDLPGDYNDDGKVDAADYVVWRKTGINGQQGYDDWRANFGAMAGSGGSTASGLGSVPEPSGPILLLSVVFAGLCGRRRSN